jgi:hypothetical protein
MEASRKERVMATRFALVAAVAVALAAPTWGQDDGRGQKQIRIDVSGFSLNIKTNPVDPSVPVKGFNPVMEGRSNLGSVLVSTTNSIYGAPTDVIPEWCTYPSTDMVRALSVAVAPEVGVRFGANGDLLVIKGEVSDPDAAICIDLSTRQFMGSQGGLVVGGTGRFDGATGTYGAFYRGWYFTPTFSDAVLMMETRFEVVLDR